MADNQRRNRRFRISVFASAAILLLLVAAIAVWQPWKPDAKPLRVGIATWPGFAPGFVAKEQGYFGDTNVELLVLDDFSARRAAYTSRQTDATVYTLDSFALEAPQGVTGQVVLVLDESAGGDAILGQPDIESATDLIGKSVAFTRGSPSHFLLLHYLSENKIAANQITTIQVDDPGRAGEALAGGSAAAAVTWQPFISQLVNSKKAHILLSTKDTPGLIVDVLVVRPEIIKERPDDVRRLVAGWLRAIEFIKQHPDKANSVMADSLKIPLNDFSGMVQGLKFADMNQNQALLTDNGGEAATQLFDRAGKFWVDAGLNKSVEPGRAYQCFVSAGGTMSSLLALVAILGVCMVLWRAQSRSRSTGITDASPSRLTHHQIIGAFAGVVVVIAAWQFASDWVRDPLFLPSPLTTLSALGEIWIKGDALMDTLVTIRRVAIAMVIAGGLGIAIGLTAGLYPQVGSVLLPCNSAARYIPPTAFISLVILYFGLNEMGRVALICLAVIWYIVQMTADTIRQVPRILIESAETLGANRREMLLRLFLPYCLPELAAVLRINVGAAWTYVVVAELVTGQDGLGHALSVNQRLLQTPRVFAIILTIGLLGFITDALLAVAIRWLGRWK